jgi:hypothetical protein
MSKKVVKVIAHLPMIPDWLKIDNTITVPLPLKTAKELAKKLLEMQDDLEIEISFASGKDKSVEIKYDNEKIEPQ